MNNKEQKVSIGLEDINVIRNFWKHFKLKPNKELENALNAFEKEPTFVNQELLAKAVANSITNDDGNLFSDKMFIPLSAESKKIADYNQFEKDLSEVLAIPPKKDET